MSLLKYEKLNGSRIQGSAQLDGIRIGASDRFSDLIPSFFESSDPDPIRSDLKKISDVPTSARLYG